MARAAMCMPIDLRLRQRLRPHVCDWSFRFFFLFPSPTTTTTQLITPHLPNSASKRKQSAVVSICCESQSCSSEIHQQPPADRIHSCSNFWTSASCTAAIRRRKATLQLAMAFTVAIVSSAVPPSSLALDDDFRVYSDDINKYRIVIPRDWQVGSGEGNGIKSVTAFYPEDSSSTSNVSVVITVLGPDFTRLESFGEVDAFAETLVSGLDRSWQRPPGVAAKLIDSKATNGLLVSKIALCDQDSITLSTHYRILVKAANIFILQWELVTTGGTIDFTQLLDSFWRRKRGSTVHKLRRLCNPSG